MDSLYQGLPETTALHPDYKIYGQDLLNTASNDELFREMKLMLGIDKCATKAHMVTNIVNIYEHIKGVKQFDLAHDEFHRLECCLKIKYPRRLCLSPAVDNMGDVLVVKKRKWCAIQ